MWDWYLFHALAAIGHDVQPIVRRSVRQLRPLRARLIGQSRHRSGTLWTSRSLVTLTSFYGDLQTRCNRQVLAYRLMGGIEVLLTGAPQLLFPPHIRRDSILHVSPTLCSQSLGFSSFYSLALVRRGKEPKPPMCPGRQSRQLVYAFGGLDVEASRSCAGTCRPPSSRSAPKNGDL
jgi:hypothetical protein